MSEPKSVGLLFKAALMRANLAGRKTVTRRQVSRTNSLISLRGETPHQASPADWNDLDWSQAVHNGESWQVCQKHQDMGRVMVPVYVYPRWQAGQEMWAKETWATRPAWDHLKPSDIPEGYCIYYRADIPEAAVDTWRSSMFMPRWACRFSRPILSVTPTRLQEIDDADARREGIATACICTEGRINWQCPEHTDPMGFGMSHRWPVKDFRHLFESIHGERVWEQNPPLWRVEYGEAPDAYLG